MKNPNKFFCSQHDSSFWGVFDDDRPNKFYGHADNLPKRVYGLAEQMQRERGKHFSLFVNENSKQTH